MTSSPPNAFELLLERLDDDLPTAAEKYEILRLKMVKSAVWKNCPESEADNLADIALDRLAAKIEKGEIIENLNAYAYQILRFVLLEFSRKRKEDAMGDDLPEIAVQPDFPDETDLRVECLRKCLREKIPDLSDRSLIQRYYDTEAGEKLKDIRFALANEYGISKENLKIKAFRLRARLEKCINDCLENSEKTVTEKPFPDTYQRSEGGRN